MCLKRTRRSPKSREKYKSLALKARKVLSDEEVSCSESDDEEYAMAVRDFKKFFRRRGKFVRQPHDDKKNFQNIKEDKKEKEDCRCFKCGDPNHFISDCPKHSYNDQKAFVVVCWSDSEEDSKKEETCLMALDNNEVLSDTPYYSSSSLDSESLQNEYNKLCKISLRIINKNKHLRAKNDMLRNKTCDLRKRVEQLERNKEACLKCESCNDLQLKVSSLSLKPTSFESSSIFLQEMLEKQKTQKDKHGIGFTANIASTSNTKTKKSGLIDKEMSTVELALPVPYAREPASSIEQNRLSAENAETLESNIVRLKVKLETDEWIKYSGCSRHMMGNKDLFSSYKAIDGEPKNVKEAIQDESWTMVMQEELNQFKTNDVWSLVPPPNNQTIIDLCDDFSKIMHEEFEMSMMGELKFFLGLQIKQLEDDIFFNQSKYIKEMLKEFSLEDSKPIKTPMSSETKLTRDEDGEFVNDTKYHGMIGSLLYLTASQPDIMFSVCLWAHFQEVPKTSHLEAVKRIFRYIKGTTHLGL
ncbi:zf-CCHC domain-containing protein [Tanacetum coccineum]